MRDARRGPALRDADFEAPRNCAGSGRATGEAHANERSLKTLGRSSCHPP